MHNQRKSNKFSYLTIDELVSLIEEPQRSGCFSLLSDNKIIFQEALGSTHNHQAWPGGYLDHIQEAMNVALKLYDCLHALRPLPFSKSDALVAIFFHDLEKPWKYEKGLDGWLRHKNSFKTKKDQHDFRVQKLKEYGILLTLEQENAVKYAEGELDDYTNKNRVMGPLAAFCHICDVVSARLWFNHPLEQSDPWYGSTRNP